MSGMAREVCNLPSRSRSKSGPPRIIPKVIMEISHALWQAWRHVKTMVFMEQTYEITNSRLRKELKNRKHCFCILTFRSQAI